MLPGLLAAGVIAGAAWAVRGRSAAVLGPVTWRGPSTEQSIALTFDDGPSEGTPALLDLLDAHGAKATFFVCGRNVRRLPGVLREVVARGHEVGNHTETHAALYLKRPGEIRREVVAAQESIAETAGVRPVWFRPPYGCRWPGLAEVLEEQGLRLAMWTAIGSDWRWPAERVAGKLERAVRPGAIVCLHDGRELTANPEIAATLGAVRVIMPRLKENGFRFPTVSQLICPTQSSNASSR